MRSFKDTTAFEKGFQQRKDLLKRPNPVQTQPELGATFDTSVSSETISPIITIDDFKDALNHFSNAVRADWLRRRPQ